MSVNCRTRTPVKRGNQVLFAKSGLFGRTSRANIGNPHPATAILSIIGRNAQINRSGLIC